MTSFTKGRWLNSWRGHDGWVSRQDAKTREDAKNEQLSLAITDHRAILLLIILLGLSR